MTSNFHSMAEKHNVSEIEKKQFIQSSSKEIKRINEQLEEVNEMARETAAKLVREIKEKQRKETLKKEEKKAQQEKH